jgi:hypothetical protein
MSEALTLIKDIKKIIKEIENDLDLILKNQKKKKGEELKNERE